MSQSEINRSHEIDIKRLSRLSRIALSENEEQFAKDELKKMADYTYSLIKNEDTSLPFSYSQAPSCMREDIPTLLDADEAKRIVKLSPSSTDGYISVPKVIKEDNE